MLEALKATFLGKSLYILIISMLPVVELRLAIPIGATLELPMWEVFFIAVLGNMIPVPFILFFGKKVLSFLKRKSKWLGRLAEKLETKSLSKAEKIHKYSLLGLALFVAIPLPGTGAWTGSFIAALLDLRIKKAMLAIFIGVLAAGLIMTLASYGVVHIFDMFVVK